MLDYKQQCNILISVGPIYKKENFGLAAARSAGPVPTLLSCIGYLFNLEKENTSSYLMYHMVNTQQCIELSPTVPLFIYNTVYAVHLVIVKFGELECKVN